MISENKQITDHSRNKSYADLVNQLKQNNPDAIRSLIHNFNGRLKHYGFVKYTNVEKDIVVDAISQTFIKVINSIDSFQFVNDQSFSNWIFTIFKNEIISNIRTSKTERIGGRSNLIHIDDTETFNFQLSDESDMESNLVKRDFIKRILDELPKHYSLILYYYVAGFSETEIALIFNKSPNSIKAIKQRAIKKAKFIAESY